MWKIAVAVVGLGASLVFAGAPSDTCKLEITALVKGGPGWGFILMPDAVAVTTGWARRRIYDPVHFGNIYICDACSRPNGSKDNKAKFVDCAGCGQPINGKTHVHKVFTQGGVRLFHIDAAFYDGESFADVTAEPWTCGHCDRRNEAGTKVCSSCGADPLAGKHHPIPHGVDLVLIPDPSDVSGYRLEPREGKAALLKKKASAAAGQVASATSPIWTPISNAVSPVVAPLVDRASQMTRRQFAVALFATAAVATPITWWALTPYVPDLPDDFRENGVITRRQILREVKILEVDDRGNAKEVDHLVSRLDIKENEPANSLGMKSWPLPAERYLRDTKRYRISHHQEYYITVDTASYEHHLPLSATEVQQWRVGDRVFVVAAPGGAGVGIGRAD